MWMPVAELSRMRMTTFSPHTVGRVATRRSIMRPPWLTDSRPSCGLRRSAMSMSAMIFRREMTPFWMFFGARCISCITPSMRYRTPRSNSPGSMWMSLARSWMAWLMSRLTNRTIGASSSFGSDSARTSSVVPTSSSQHGAEGGELAVGAMEAVDRRAKVGGFGDDALDLHPRDGGHVVDREHVARVGHGEHQVLARLRDRQHVVAAAHRGRHHRHGLMVDGEVEQLDERQRRPAPRAPRPPAHRRGRRARPDRARSTPRRRASRSRCRCSRSA